MDVTNYIYTRPEHTHQDLLSEQDIKDKLKDYKLITKPAFLPNTCYVRLWVLKRKKPVANAYGLLDVSSSKTTNSARLAKVVEVEEKN